MRYIGDFCYFIQDLFKSRGLIFELTKKDIEARYLGSYLGVFWAFVQPTINILIFWFVFEVGFKSKPVDNVPFILWLMTGMLPWFFFSESISSATNSVIENSYLVKKVVFRVSVLPVIKICSALCIHLFFMIVLFLMYGLYGYGINIYHLQLIYYLFAMLVLILGISWITSSLVIFLRDVGQAVNMLVQFCFWLTPIFWSVKMVPQKYHKILQLNPIYYLIEGYRNSMIYHKWFWEDFQLTLSYWGVTLLLVVTGALLYRRLRPHFADVL